MGDFHVVFGASGGAGGALVRKLAEAGRQVRAVSRRGRGPAPKGVEVVRADAGDPEAARAACAGAAVVYHCMNVPYSRWAELLPALMDNLIAAAGEVDAKLVYTDNVYMYGPVEGTIREDSPRVPTGPKGRLRGRLVDHLLEAHARGRVRATVGCGSDFFGPDAANTIAGQLVFPAVVAGKKAHWLGSLDEPHSLSYTDDFARGLITLADGEKAGGEVWHIPAGPALTGRQFVEMAFSAADRPARVGGRGSA